jgi:hypothetical protein
VKSNAIGIFAVRLMQLLARLHESADLFDKPSLAGRLQGQCFQNLF